MDKNIDSQKKAERIKLLALIIIPVAGIALVVSIYAALNPVRYTPKAAGIRPTLVLAPSATPTKSQPVTGAHPVNWSTSNLNLSADDFSLMVDNQTFYGTPDASGAFNIAMSSPSYANAAVSNEPEEDHIINWTELGFLIELRMRVRKYQDFWFVREMKTSKRDNQGIVVENVYTTSMLGSLNYQPYYGDILLRCDGGKEKNEVEKCIIKFKRLKFAPFYIAPTPTSPVSNVTVTSTATLVVPTATSVPPAGNNNPVINTTSLPAGIPNSSYSASLSGYDKDLNDTLTMITSTLPTGLTLQSCGKAYISAMQQNGYKCSIKGTPTQAGTSNITITLTDNKGAAVTKTLSLTVQAYGVATTKTP